MKLLKNLSLILSLSIMLFSCSSDDDNGGGGEEAENCTEISSQAAEGNFRGTQFVNAGGTYIEAPGAGTGYNCSIYVKVPLNQDCVFPIFSGTQDVIRFSIDALETQTLTLSELSGATTTLNFNRIEDGVTLVELATCGIIEITAYDSVTGELQGKVIAIGQEGSTIDGSFTLSLCVF